jgi:hypothetical protein
VLGLVLAEVEQTKNGIDRGYLCEGKYSSLKGVSVGPP